MNILTTEDARFIDREVPKQLGISLEILMENAGRGIVDALWGEYDLFFLNNGRSINSFVLFKMCIRDRYRTWFYLYNSCHCWHWGTSNHSSL